MRNHSMFFCAALCCALPANLLAHAQAPSKAPASQAPSGQASSGQPAPFDIRTHYTKAEYHIPMRDGVTLFTSVYTPKDTSTPYPFLVTRTCYSVAPYGPDNYRNSLGPSREFAKSGYIFVYQDVRGRYGSEGTWEEATPHIDHPTGKQHDESTDFYDTVEWLLKNVPNNNGRVGILGISYPGFYTSASIIDGHPAIKAASPQAPVTDLHDNDDAYHNGAFMLEANDFYLSFRPQHNPDTSPEREERGQPAAADAYAEYLQQWEPLSRAKQYVHNPLFDDQVNHPAQDAYWDERDISRHLHNIHAAVLTVGGWFDAEDLSGPHKTFQAIARQSPETSNQIVIGPWVHGGWAALDGARLGEVTFGTQDGLPSGEYFRKRIQFPFFEHYLKDAPDPHLAKATMFETGSNVWKSYPAWPPPGSQPKMLYFQPGGKLSFTPPAANSGAGFDEYVSDPAHPVPELSYAHDPGPPRDYMVADQRFAAERPDVLTYQTDVLTGPVTFAGPLRAHLHVSSSGTDSDFVVKLIDVYPQEATQGEPPRGPRPHDVAAPPPLIAGYEQLVRGEPMRAKYRESFAKPVPLTPGKPALLDFSLVQVNHTFLPGHRIMVQVQSSWFPLVDLNPQQFEDISKARPEDFHPATERLYHSQDLPSGLQFQSLK